jgi:drug/metabolite transporter (DMT)-like permease
VPSRLYDRPIGAALAGALAISFSGILFRAAHVSPSTGAFYRCALALPVLWPLRWLEDRRFGRAAQAARARVAGRRLLRDRPDRLARGDRAGRRRARNRARQPAGRVRRLLAWMILGERPSNRSLAAIPVALFGVLLISGVFESGAYGKNPGSASPTGS